jgi:hypothetical protein
VGGLVCSLHRPTVYSCQRDGQSLLTGDALSRHVVVVGGAFSGDTKPHAWIFDVVLTVRVPVTLNLIWRSPPLPGHPYPT